MERQRSAQLQVAATGFLSLFSIVGLALYGLPFYYDFMVREFGWTRTEVTSGNALSKLLVGPLFGFAAGWVVDRFGPRRLMMAGIVTAGVAVVGLSMMSGALWMLYLFYLFNALGYVCGGPLPNQILLSRWFDKSRGKAMGFAYLGIGIGGAVVPLLSRRLTDALGWHGASCVIGILIILIGLPMAYFVKESPEDIRGETKQSAPLVPIGHILRSPAFYLLAFGSMCSIGAVGGANQHLKLFLSLDEHYAQAEAAKILSLVLAFSIAGRLVMGWLADRIARKHVMLLIYFLIAAAIPLLFLAASPGPLYLFAAVFGLGLGGEYMIIPLMAAELFGTQALGRLLGIVLTADGVAEATLPMFVGFLRDKSGSYHIGFCVLIGIALLGAGAIAILPRSRRATNEIIPSPLESGSVPAKDLI